MGNESIELRKDRISQGDSARAASVWLIFALLAGLTAYMPTLLSLVVHHTAGDTYYAHWFLIPAISALLIWMKRDRLRPLPLEGSRLGIALAVLSLALHVFAVWFRVDFVSALSLVVTVWGVALYLLGRRIVREIRFALLFLLFMVPLPGTVITPIAFHMKIFSGKIAVRLFGFLGGTALLTGSKITFSHGEPLWMGYECSGLKSVIAASSLGVAIAYLARISKTRKLLLFLSSFPLAIISNAIRVTSLCFAATRWGVTSKTYERFHDVSSPVVFVLMLGSFYGVYKLLSLNGREPVLKPQFSAKPREESATERWLPAIGIRKLVTVFGLFMVAVVLVILSPHSLVPDARMSSLAPVELPQEVGRWRMTETENMLREKDFSILNTNSIVSGSYRNPLGREVQILVVASDTDRGAFHPPEICMMGAAYEVLARWREPIRLGSPDGSSLNANAFIRGMKGQPETLVLYWYMVEEKSTGSRARQQLLLLLKGASRTPPVGAMVRLTVSLLDMTREEALECSRGFIRSFVPMMPSVLKTARNQASKSRD